MIRKLLLPVFLIIFSCQPPQQTSSEELLMIDKKFSEASGKIGFNNAFIQFAHEDAVLLRDNNMPLEGKKAIIELYQPVDTSKVTFSWQPIAARISKSGELGYTYGTYEFKKDTSYEKGTYVTIWKKNNQGEWKYILDSGNEGL